MEKLEITIFISILFTASAILSAPSFLQDDEWRDQEGTAYLPHVDGYYYLALAEKLTPFNLQAFPTILWVFGFFFKPFTHSFIGGVALYPIACGLVVLCLVYAIASTIGGSKAGLFAAGLLSVSPQFFRTFQWGYTDTNAINVLLSTALLGITYLLLTRQHWLGKSEMAMLGICAAYLFWRIWSGSFFFILLASGILAAIMLLKVWGIVLKRFNAAFLLFPNIAAGMLTKIKAYFGLSDQGVLPNLIPYLTEMRELGPLQLMAELGGPVVVALLAAGLIFLGWKAIKYQKNRDGALFLILWLLLLAYPSTRLRFLQFSIIPVSVIAGVGLAGVVQILIQKLKVPSSLTYVVGGLLIVGIIPLTLVTVRAETHMVNDALVEVSTTIRENTDKDSVIAAWWTYGYAYQYFAERETYFDGSSPDSYLSYWMSRWYLEQDPDVSLNLLKAMSCEKTKMVIGNIERVKNVTRMIQDGHGDIYCENPKDTYVILSEDLFELFWAFDWYNKTDFDRAPKSGRSELNIRAMDCIKEIASINCDSRIVIEKETARYAGSEISFIRDGRFYDGSNSSEVLILYEEGEVLRGAIVRRELLTTMFVRLFFLNDVPQYEKIAEASIDGKNVVKAYRVRFRPN